MVVEDMEAEIYKEEEEEELVDVSVENDTAKSAQNLVILLSNVIIDLIPIFNRNPDLHSQTQTIQDQ